MQAWRLVLAVLGIAGLVYGVARLLTEIPVPSLVALAIWLVGAVVVHEGLLSPAVLPLAGRSDAALAGVIAAELGTGLALGLVIRLMFLAISIAGSIIRRSSRPGRWRRR